MLTKTNLPYIAFICESEIIDKNDENVFSLHVPTSVFCQHLTSKLDIEFCPALLGLPLLQCQQLNNKQLQLKDARRTCLSRHVPMPHATPFLNSDPARFKAVQKNPKRLVEAFRHCRQAGFFLDVHALKNFFRIRRFRSDLFGKVVAKH